MSLLDRIEGIEEPPLGVHQLTGAVYLVRKGALTPAEVKAMFALSDADATALTAWVTHATRDRDYYEAVLELLQDKRITRAKAISLLT